MILLNKSSLSCWNQCFCFLCISVLIDNLIIIADRKEHFYSGRDKSTNGMQDHVEPIELGFTSCLRKEQQFFFYVRLVFLDPIKYVLRVVLPVSKTFY